MENSELKKLIRVTKGALFACGCLANKQTEGEKLFHTVISLRDSIVAAMTAYKITHNEKILASICHLIDALANVMVVQLNNDHETLAQVKQMINDWFDYWTTEKKKEIVP